MNAARAMIEAAEMDAVADQARRLAHRTYDTNGVAAMAASITAAEASKAAMNLRLSALRVCVNCGSAEPRGNCPVCGRFATR